MRKFNDGAASEILGYILLFTIVITSIALVLLAGNGVLEQTKTENNFRSMEAGFSVIHSDLKQVALEKAPVKTTSVHMEGGTLYSNTSTGPLKVTFDGHTYEEYTGQIVYVNRDFSEISVENGGLWKHYNTNASDVLVMKPRIYGVPETRTLVLNVIRLNATPLANSGVGTLNIEMRYNDTSVITYEKSGAPGEVTLTYETRYPNAWVRFYKDNLEPLGFPVTIVSQSDNKITVKISGVSELIISEHVIDAKFGGYYV